MRNAFETLGATPNDDNERLQELFEEQQLLADDTTEIELAYAELSNPKKRIVHEVSYFADESLGNYVLLVKNEFSERPNVSETAQIIVDAGLFLESAANKLFEQINDSRLISDFPSIEESDLSNIIETLNNEYVALGAAYFDGITEKSLVAVFNAIVKIEDYQSYFIDDLIEHYRLKIEDSLHEKEDKCRESFDEVERHCNRFNNEGVLSYFVTEKANQFVKELKEWDKLAQPLQVNMQYHGGEDEESSSFARNIRNRVIDIVNDTQEVIGRLLNSLNQSNPYDTYIARYQAVQQLPDKLTNSITIIDVMLTIINGLISVFSELDVATEQLKKDRSDLTGLRSTLSNLNNQIETAKRAASQRPVYRSSGGCYVATCVYGSYDCPEVWTLRRYRDYKLSKTWYGRAFIHLYYAVSPTIVKWFGKTKWFKKIWKGTLDRMVKNLENKGFDNTPYNDKDWKK